MYELFEHTADLGIRARAPTIEGVFAEAARGLFAAAIEDVNSIEPRTTHTFTVVGEDDEYLLFDWLRELLRAYDSDQMLYCQFEVRRTPTGIVGIAHGEPVDGSRHVLTHEVKAITYHEFTLRPDADGWLAECIVDI